MQNIFLKIVGEFALFGTVIVTVEINPSRQVIQNALM